MDELWRRLRSLQRVAEPEFGFPIVFTLMALGFGYFAMGDIVFALVVQRAYG
jgi:hypothetical protein